MFFEKSSRRKYRLGGQSKTEESRDQVLNRTRVEREQRRQHRLQTASATTIQAVWRGYCVRKLLRQVFQDELTSMQSNDTIQIDIFQEEQRALTIFMFIFDATNAQHIYHLVTNILPNCQVNDKILEPLASFRLNRLACLSLDVLYVNSNENSEKIRQYTVVILMWLNEVVTKQERVAIELVQQRNGIGKLSKVFQNVSKAAEFVFKVVAIALKSAKGVNVGKVDYWRLLCIPRFLREKVNVIVNVEFAARLFQKVVEEMVTFADPKSLLCQFKNEKQAQQLGVVLMGNILSLACSLLPNQMPGWSSVGWLFCETLLLLMKALPIRQLLQDPNRDAIDKDDDEEEEDVKNDDYQKQAVFVPPQSYSNDVLWPILQLQSKDMLHWVISNAFPCLDSDGIMNWTASDREIETMKVASQLLSRILKCERLQVSVRITFISSKHLLIRRLWFSALRQPWRRHVGHSQAMQVMLEIGSDWIEMFGLWGVAFSTYSRSAFDDSFYQEQYNFSLDEIYWPSAPDVGVLAALKFILVQNCWVQKTSYSTRFVASQETLSTCKKMFTQLYERNSRRAFCPREAFHSSALVLKQGPAEVQFVMQEGDEQKVVNDPRANDLLQNAPFLIAFEERVKLFRSNIEKDRQEVRGMQQDFLDFNGMGQPDFKRIRRNMILEDGFEQLNQLGQGLKSRVRISFIDEHGMEEAGVDGGGLFKDFMENLLVQGFNATYGLFIPTSDNQLYPNSSAASIIPDALKVYGFLGRMLGKALYEGIIVELPFAHFFLKKILQVSTDINDMTTLDAELYEQLVHLSRYKGNVEDLCLTFSVSSTEFGDLKEIDLIPRGREIPVTNENVLMYVYHMADFKLRRQIHIPTQAFLQGFYEIIDPQWIKTFSAEELHMLIAGSSEKIDLLDMQRNTNYTGGYHSEHQSIQFFWKVMHGFSHEQQRKVLRFITACSRAPLLGFQYLQPRICIQMAAPEEYGHIDRLPTASTCINLLKLPSYNTEKQLQQKLLYAIQQTEGFNLS